MIWVDYLIFPILLVLIVSILLQKSDDDIQAAFSGEKSELFQDKKLRGPELFLNRVTLVATILFVVLVIVSRIIERY